MKIHSVWAENARGIDTRVELDVFVDGLTVISAPNEWGKSTLAQVPQLLMTLSYKAKTQSIKQWQPLGKPGVSVRLGMTFSVGGKKFEIEKNYVAAPSARFAQIEPVGREYKNDEAEEQLRRTLSSIDLDLFAVLSTAQGVASSVLRSKTSPTELRGNTTLQAFLDLAAEQSVEDDSLPLVALVKLEYEKWWTSRGLTTAAGTLGRELHDVSSFLSEAEANLHQLSKDLESRTEAIAKLEISQVDKHDPKVIRATQSKQSRFAELTGLLSKGRELALDDSSLKFLSDQVEAGWTLGLHQELFDTQLPFLKMQASSSLRVTALNNLELTVLGDKSILPKAGEAVVPQVPGTSFEIKDVARIDFLVEDGGFDEAEVSQAKRHAEILKSLKLVDARESSKILLLEEQRNQLAEFVSTAGSIEILDLEHKQLSEERSRDADLWELATNLPPVTDEELVGASDLTAEIRVRKEELERLGLASKIADASLTVEDLKEKIERLQARADAAKLLLETVERHRQSSQVNLAKLLENGMQKHVGGMFGTDAVVSLADDLSVDLISKSGKSIPTDWLSSGAQELLALSFRLAIADAAEATSGLPVILDDDFSQIDKARIQRLAKHFKLLGKQQIILFTHQPEKLEALEGKRIELAPID